MGLEVLKKLDNHNKPKSKEKCAKCRFSDQNCLVSQPAIHGSANTTSAWCEPASLTMGIFILLLYHHAYQCL